MKKKVLICVVAVVLVLCCAVGGTIAWLTATTAPVTNTFTVGDINIDLTETTTDYKMVPGNTIKKDPTVTVKAGSEACWLFVKIEKSTNLSTFIDYAIAEGDDGWKELTGVDGVDGVYYREVPATTADTSFAVLKDNQVKVLDIVNKEQMNALKVEGAMQPTLTFTAYAVQKDNITDAAAAWAKLTPSA